MNINMGCVDVNTLPEAEKEAMAVQRRKGLTHMRRLAFCQITVGVISCVVGILSIVYGAHGNPSWPYVAGFGLWIGVLAIIIGTFGVMASNQGMQSIDVTKKIKTFVILNYVFSIISFSPCVLTMVWSGIGIGRCNDESNKDHKDCLPYKDEKIAMAVVTMICGSIVGVMSMLCAILFCVYGRTYGFSNRHAANRRLQSQVHQLQGQVEDLRREQAPPPYEATAADNNAYYKWDEKP